MPSPFAEPAAVLAYLLRYTHRVAISNWRLVCLDEHGVTFRWKDYRISGRTRDKTMTLSPQEFMRPFLLHVLPGGFHGIRHYGLLANRERRENLAKARELLGVAAPNIDTSVLNRYASGDVVQPTSVCTCCGSPMRIIEPFLLGQSR
jgi:hypothetical protein